MAIPILTKFKVDTSNLERGTKRAKRQFDSLKASASRLGGVIAGALAIGGLRKITDDLDRIGKISQRFNTTAEAVQKLGLAAELGGADLESLIKGLQKSALAAVEAQRGAKSYQEAFDALGISVEEYISEDLTGQFLILAKAIDESGNGTEGLAAALRILGTKGADLVPTLRQGSEALEALFDGTKVADGATVQAAQDLNDALTELKQSATVALSPLVVVFAKIFEGIELAATALKGFGNILGEFVSGQVDVGSAILGGGGMEAAKDAFDQSLEATNRAFNEYVEETSAKRDEFLGLATPGGPKSNAPTDLGPGDFLGAPGDSRFNFDNTPQAIGGPGPGMFPAFMAQLMRGGAISARDGQRDGLYNDAISSIEEAVGLTREKRALAAGRGDNVLGDSLARVGGGGGVSVSRNPQVARLDALLEKQRDAIAVLEEIRDKDETALELN